MLKILHTADWHVRDKEIEESERCLKFLCDKATDVDLVIIAGDIFDSRDVKLDSQSAKLAIKTIADLAEICPVAIVTGTPSHDGLAVEIASNWKDGHGVTVASRPLQVKYCRQRLYPLDYDAQQNIHAVISLIPTPTKQFFQTNSDIQTGNVEISQAMNGLFAGFGAQAAAYEKQPSGGEDCPHILVGHWNVSGSKLPTGQTLTGQDIDISVDQMMLANPDLICLGHIHLQQQFSDRVFYSGSLIPLNWGENTEHGFYIHTLEGKKLVSSEFIQAPCRKLVRVQADITQAGSPTNIDFNFYGDNFNGAFVRADITAWQDEACKIDKDCLKNHFIKNGALDADIRIIRLPRQTVRSDAVLKVETLRDKLVAMAALNNETIPESILQKADTLENTESAKLLEVA